MVESLGEALPKEIERVQELIKLYEEAPYGFITANLMKRDIQIVHRAMVEGDIVTMLSVYQELKEWKE